MFVVISYVDNIIIVSFYLFFGYIRFVSKKVSVVNNLISG